MAWIVSFTSYFVFKQCLSWIKDRTTTEVTLPRPQHNIFLTCIELLSSFLPCPSPSILSEFLQSEFCMFQVSCELGIGGESPARIPPPATPPCVPCVHLCAHLPAFCGPQYGWCISLCEHVVSLALHLVCG